jgi:hypothetical protein
VLPFGRHHKLVSTSTAFRRVIEHHVANVREDFDFTHFGLGDVAGTLEPATLLTSNVQSIARVRLQLCPSSPIILFEQV